MYLVGYIQGQWQFCCSPWVNQTCDTATNGSKEPFSLENEQVIFNRTSGSTSTTTANAPATATSITTVTALTQPSNSSSVANSSLSCSRNEAAVGAGLGLPLGLALLVALGLLWRQRKQKQSLRTNAQTWEGRYKDVTTNFVTRSGVEHQQIHQLPAWTPGELDGRPESRPSEMADKPR